MTLFNLTIHDPYHGPQHVVVSSPFGGGGSFQVIVNDFYRGQIIRHTTGWTSYVKSPVLTPDDIDAIIDAIITNE